MQTAGDLVAVVVELAASMKFRQCNFGCRTLRFVFVVELDGCRNATAVIDNAYGVVHVDCDVNLGGVARHGLVNGVVHHFVNEMMQTGAVGDVADVHARTLTNSLKTFQNLDVTFVVRARDVRLDFLISHFSLKIQCKNVYSTHLQNKAPTCTPLLSASGRVRVRRPLKTTEQAPKRRRRSN